MLLAHVLGCERVRLYMEVDRPASPHELEALRSLVARASRQEPVQYLVAEAWFYGRKFAVDRSTLIPRPSTETLVEQVLRWLNAAEIDQPIVGDLGTGTGCIAVSIALHSPKARVLATDIVPEAVALAQRNAAAHGVIDRIELHKGGGVVALRQAIGGDRFDVICSNPPYIPDAEWPEVADNVRLFEPEAALRGGPDGLAVIRPLIADAPDLLNPGGLLAIEIADSTKDAVFALASAQPALSNVEVIKDHEGLWRVLMARRTPPAA